MTELPLSLAGARPQGGPVSGFTDVTREAGIDFRHQKGTFDSRLGNIMPWIASIGAAAAVSDHDLDGDLDLYLTSSKQGAPNALYRNDGGLKFTEVGEAAGVARVNDAEGVSMDAAFADLDNDGRDDLYVVQWGKNRLFHNREDGRFADITDASGTGDRSNGNCVLPFDYDNDGRVDLLVGNYFPSVDLTRLDTTRIMHESFEAARNGGANVVYHNLGGLRFENAARSLNLDDTGWTLDAGLSDVDNDGDLDVYIANDFGQDKLYLANGNGTFTDATERSIGHETFKGMNIDFGDFDGDGFTDGYVANITTAEYLKEGNMLLLNRGDGTFSNVAAATGTFDGGWGWCARFFDFDGDGHLDILGVNGFISAGPQIYWEDLANIAVDPQFDPQEATAWPTIGNRSLSGHEPARLWRNRGDGSFEEVAGKYGIADRRDGRGIALADFDEDGDIDAYIANQDGPGALYRNDVGNTHHFLELTLQGRKSSRNAIGARVQIIASGGGRELRLTREVNGCNGYSSQAAYRLHFGLAQADTIARATVIWPSGLVQELEGLAADRHYLVVEDGEALAPEARRALYFGQPRQGRVAGESPVEGGPARGADSILLLDLEEKIRRQPCNSGLGGAYRSLCVDSRQFDRSIELYRGLVRTHGEHDGVRLQFSLAIIDKIPSLDGDVLAQGSLAKEALNELRVVEERDPRSYALHYIAGMNHLYWPDTLNHFHDAIKYFTRCVEAQKARASAGRPPEPHHAEVYRALGDGHVKARQFDRARAIWREGLALFPGDASLMARLEPLDEALSNLVKEERGLRKRIDSRLPWLAAENGLERAEAALRLGEAGHQLLNGYRQEAFEVGQVDRVIAFLDGLRRERPSEAALELHAVLALADKVSAIGAATPEAFRLGAEILGGLEAYCRKAPGDWMGPYFTGICHLFQPPSPAATGAAVAAFEASDRMTRRADGSRRLPFAAWKLGDALALAGDPAGARALWAEVGAAFPHARALSRALARRLEAPVGSLVALVRAEHALAQGIPTNLDELADREGDLAALEASIARSPRREDLVRYRRLARGSDDPDRALRFLEAAAAKEPQSALLRVELALANIDRIPAGDLGSVRKGLLASDALKHLEEVALANPDSWGVQYTVGLVHLDWFTKLKHVPHAIKAFERCLELQRGREREEPHFVLAYQALGDALIKDRESPGSFPRGRKHWKDGLELFPGDRGLQERMGLTALMVNRYVEERRSWATVEDTERLSAIIGELPPLPASSDVR